MSDNSSTRAQTSNKKQAIVKPNKIFDRGDHVQTFIAQNENGELACMTSEGVLEKAWNNLMVKKREEKEARKIWVNLMTKAYYTVEPQVSESD